MRGGLTRFQADIQRELENRVRHEY
jgi:hypothetical protein